MIRWRRCVSFTRYTVDPHGWKATVLGISLYYFGEKKYRDTNGGHRFSITGRLVGDCKRFG